MIALLLLLVILLVVFVFFGFAVWTLISIIVVGAIIGGLARLILPGRQDIGIFATIVLGWIGSLIGGIIGRKVLHLHSDILTVLLEIGVTIVLVGIASTAAGNHLAKRDRTLRY